MDNETSIMKFKDSCKKKNKKKWWGNWDLPRCRRTLLCGFLFLVLSEEQFQRCHWNWYWHSSIANWRPSIAVDVTSGYWWQISIWSLLSPGKVLHIVGPISSCLCSMKALFTPLEKSNKKLLGIVFQARLFREFEPWMWGTRHLGWESPLRQILFFGTYTGILRKQKSFRKGSSNKSKLKLKRYNQKTF